MSDNLTIGIGAKVRHPSFGVGIITGIDVNHYTIFFKGEGDKEISRKFENLDVLESPQEVSEALDLDTVQKALKNVLLELSDISQPIELGGRWSGGKMILVPGKEGMSQKELPIETFFHKIVMMRDRLRVLEQQINKSDNLSEEEKVHLQQYITRTYGSMTTFNVLFADKKDWFSTK